MKTKLLFLILLCSLNALAQIPTTNLDSEYQFTGGSLNDTYGTAENLTRTGSAATYTTDRFGVASSAINLAGDYLQRVPIQTATSLSMSFWVKTSTNDANYRTIIDQTERNSAANTNAQRGWYVYLRNGIVGMFGNYKYNYQATGGNVITGVSGYLGCTSNTNVADNNWHHVVVTIKGRVYFWQNSDWVYENEYKIYVDNVLKNTVLHSYHTYIASGWCSSIDFLPNNFVTMGNNKLGNLATTNMFSEEIDDVRFYKTTLSAANVNSLFNESAPLSRNDFNSFSDFSIYPNPANEIVTVKSDENIESLEIFSLEGSKIKSCNATKIDISDLSSGMYIMHIKTAEGKFGTKKIIKN
jgi:hypothetical protein